MFNSLINAKTKQGKPLSDLQKASLLVGIELRYCECTSQLIRWLEESGEISDAITLKRIYTSARARAYRKGIVTRRLILETKRRLGDV